MSSLVRLCLGFLVLVLAPGLSAQEEEPSNGPWPPADRPASSDETSRRIIDLHLKARGGADRLREAAPVRFFGTIVEGLVDQSVVVTHTLDGAMRSETYRYHLGYDHRTVYATDGDKVWTRVLQPEEKLPAEIQGDEAQLLNFAAQIPFLFLDFEKKGHIFTYGGETTYAKRRAYLLHGWLAGGFRVDVHIDAERFHILNYRHAYRIGPSKVLVDRTPTGLASRAGVWWENGYKLHVRGKSFLRINFELVETRVQANPGDFALPKTREFWLRPNG